MEQLIAHRRCVVRRIDGQHLMDEPCRKAIGHEAGPFCLKIAQFRTDPLREQLGEGAHGFGVGRVRLTGTLIPAGVGDRNAAKERPERGGGLLFYPAWRGTGRTGPVLREVGGDLVGDQRLLGLLQQLFALGEG
ncbi:hypothetical protein Hgul01_05376 [Herpetosiphon gulosus]|uniref:Uncharacterized protein n=1 Tax=Herpetosiphon gulosus TaxID=1973496 RepID=A0ABP9XAQ4_9CHLR